jgi:hypothetical protein
MSLSEKYAHLTNSEVAQLLANQRFVAVGQRERRFENILIPFGDQLNELARFRLTAQATPTVPTPIEVPLMTVEAVLSQIAGLETLDDLAKAYMTLLIEQSPQSADNTDVVSAISDMKSRALSVIELDFKPEPVTPAPTEEELVARYEAITDLNTLESVLSIGESDLVQSSVTEMALRVHDAVVASIPAPEVPAEEPPVEEEPAQ